ncbi:hypothetical protein K523DRAFT_319532 [Schizophyllum commune Tattone D]|nr:hypothetical protein K523DRAFT_319532 [Schizophyllum commune Tattone D]
MSIRRPCSLHARHHAYARRNWRALPPASLCTSTRPAVYDDSPRCVRRLASLRTLACADLVRKVAVSRRLPCITTLNAYIPTLGPYIPALDPYTPPLDPNLPAFGS